MKKLLFLLILLISSIICDAQVQKFESESISIRTLKDSSTLEFNEWVPWKPSNVIIYFSYNYIHIYSQLEQQYTIISLINKIEHDGGEILLFDALDIDGIRCTVEFIHFPSEVYQLYIRWRNFQLVYQMRKI